MALFEAAFAAVCGPPFAKKKLLEGSVSSSKLGELESDKQFLDALIEGTTQTKNVKMRIECAKTLLGSP